MIEATIEVTLTLKGPVMTQSSSPGAFGLDALMATDHKGCWCLPWSLVKGKLRQSCGELGTQCETIWQSTHSNSNRYPNVKEWLNDWFGNMLDEDVEPSQATDGRRQIISSNEPQRGRLRFTDFSGAESTAKAPVNYRIKIDDYRGSVDEGHLLVMESPFKYGADAKFEGKVSWFAPDMEEAKRVATWLVLAFRWIHSFGAHRSVGFGRLHRVDFKLLNPRTITVPAASPGISPSSLLLTIQPLSPFCFAAHKTRGNLMESLPYIPGAAIKGAVAETWAKLFNHRPDGTGVEGIPDAEREELRQNYDKLRFLHAFPSKANDQGARPKTPPLSIVQVKYINQQGQDETGLFDVWNHKSPILIHGKAPVFRGGWKEGEDEFFDNLGLACPRKRLQVRTAIDGQRRKAKTSALFAQELIVPDDLKWHGRVDLAHIDEVIRAKVASQLQSLMEPCLGFLGKTKTQANVGLKPVSEPGENIALDEGMVRVVLQSDALLLNSSEQNGFLDSEALLEAYREIFTGLSEESLYLSHLFTCERYAGGNYLHQRFQKDNPYNPWLLTEAGSVFVFVIADSGKANRILNSWLREGLPIPEWAIKELAWRGLDGHHWRNNPFVPENGYGEIAVNFKVPKIEEPSQNEIQEVKHV